MTDLYEIIGLKRIIFIILVVAETCHKIYNVHMRSACFRNMQSLKVLPACTEKSCRTTSLNRMEKYKKL